MSAVNLRSSTRFVLISTSAEIASITISVQYKTLAAFEDLPPAPLSKETTQVVPRKFLKLTLAAVLFSVSTLASAQSQKTDIRPDANRLLGDELRQSFAGITHSGAYNFTEKGEPTRFYTESHKADGRISYTEEGRTDAGTWLIIKDTICYLYDAGDMPGGCFRVYRVENCYYFYSDQLIERQDELDRDYWTARSVHKGEQPKCEAAIS